jgi:ectoine hydroxylase-related dioxygenase (phytanoyl-CoA dioxygenase family)
VQRRGDGVVLRKLQPVNDVSPVFARYASDDRLLQPLRDLLGCEPILMEEKLTYKQVLPGNPEVVTGNEPDESFPFHSDFAYYRYDGYPAETLSSAICIDETTPDNGPMLVVPGSHLREWPLQPEWPPLVADGLVRADECVPVLAPAGSVCIFHSQLVHGSRRNNTLAPRRVMVFSHFPETHVIEPDKRNRELRRAGQQYEEQYEALVYSGAEVPEYRLR